MKIKALIFTIILSGCVQNNYTKQQSALIIFKTPSFKYADMGFIDENSKELRLQIYAVGQALMKLKITEDRICMSTLKCMSPYQFNKEVLDKSYPKNILSNIFRGKAIFDRIGLKKVSNGFIQKINTISYKVIGKKIIFRDTAHHILIKIKR